MYVKAFILLIKASMMILIFYSILSSIRTLKGFKRIPSPSILDVRPPVSVIVPARNEEGRIGHCVRSILRILGPSDELLVVDDDSSDRTFEEAASNCDARCSIIKILWKPEGWTGKNWACYNGYLSSSGEFLIFVDADTILNGGIDEMYSLLTIYDAVSQVPRIRCNSIACGAVEIAFTSILRLTYPYWDMEGERAWLAGAFMGWRRRSYELVGTHSAVRSSLVEDASLGRLAGEKGLKISFFKGKFAESLWISKWKEALDTLTRITRARAPRPIYAYFLLAAFTFVTLLIYIAPLMVLLGVISPILCATYIVSIFGYASLSFIEVRANPISIILAPIGLIIMGISLVKASRRETIRWKEREL